MAWEIIGTSTKQAKRRTNKQANGKRNVRNKKYKKDSDLKTVFLHALTIFAQCLYSLKSASTCWLHIYPRTTKQRRDYTDSVTPKETHARRVSVWDQLCGIEKSDNLTPNISGYFFKLSSQVVFKRKVWSSKDLCNIFIQQFSSCSQVTLRRRKPSVHATVKIIPGATRPRDLENSAYNLFPLIHLIFSASQLPEHVSQ